ncbi:MAG: hypothetical protein ABSG28_09215 [Methanoregula sp.]|jgi:hypothetical protein|uniref:hypothetical protein n=1 Tax=Methanoregula sp. TaxID=2052170 RepID=UPI003C1B9912
MNTHTVHPLMHAAVQERSGSTAGTSRSGAEPAGVVERLGGIRSSGQCCRFPELFGNGKKESALGTLQKIMGIPGMWA